jgi:Mg/Co/Ni transporter MgtE
MAANATKMARAKVSTTVAPDNYAFLQRMVTSGEASSVADALDQSIQALRQLVNRARLAAATARYFESLDTEAAAEEQAIAHDLGFAAKDIDFDKEL